MVGDGHHCKKCYHQCHCYDTSCQKELGVGMSDKHQSCGCEKCSCSPVKEAK
jgi:hypothetical protein